MTEAENSLRIINALPKEIHFKGDVFWLEVKVTETGWVFVYEEASPISPFNPVNIFATQSPKIENAAFGMYEILTENNLIK